MDGSLRFSGEFQRPGCFDDEVEGRAARIYERHARTLPWLLVSTIERHRFEIRARLELWQDGIFRQAPDPADLEWPEP